MNLAEGDGELTGGRVNVAGILYQLLVSLAEGLETTVTQCRVEPEKSTVILHVEPYGGGDVQVITRERRVIQIKMKSAHLYWTLGEIFRRVLPDLFKAARPDSTDRYIFVTDNADGCASFGEFLKWYRAGDSRDTQPSFAHGRGGKKHSGEQILEIVAKELGLSDGSDPLLASFLSQLEFVHAEQDTLEKTIDQHLEVLVEAIEDVRHKRKQLIGELVDLGSTGKRVTTSELLAGAHLDTRRFVHASTLAEGLRDRLAATFTTFGYDPDQDVRAALPMPQRSLTILRGESGLGKSWRLCATARALAAANRPVVLLRAISSAETLRNEVATAVWNPSYSAALPLASIAERLRSKLADDRGVWLTVFLDDLNDPALAQQLVDARLQDLGIDLVISSQPMTADWLRHAAAADVYEIAPFSYLELVAYLEANQVEVSEIKPDVFELLLKPVFAKLYCLLPRGLITRAESEYELLEQFWQYAATYRAAQVPHSFDLDRLQILVGTMLSGAVSYPWPPGTFLPLLDDQAIGRLTRSGLVELTGDRQLSMTHDRLLNWTTARHIAAMANQRNLSAADLLSVMKQVEALTSASGVSIGNRLGYVLMDLVWMQASDPARTPTQVADFLLAYMRDPSFDAYRADFFERLLASLGTRGVPVVRALVEKDLSGEREVLWPEWAAAALRKMADVAWDEVREAAVALFRSGESQRVEVALRVLRKMGSSDLLPELLQLTVGRERARQGGGERMIDLLHSRQRAFKAFARSITLDLAWLDRRLAAVTDPVEAEQILWALLQLPRSSSIELWRSHREHLFAVIPAGRRVLPRAVKAFADPGDLPRLQLPAPPSADPYFEAATVAAIAKLSPRQALELLETDDRTDTGFDETGAEGWWMPGLYQHVGERLGAVLLDRCQRVFPDKAVKELTFLYLGRPAMIEPASVQFLLDELEAIVADQTKPVQEREDQAYRLLQLLGSLRTPRALERIADRRGSPLEQGLCDLVTQRPPSSSRIVDREVEKIAFLLACMAGEGFDQLVLTELASSGTTTREYGYRHALWTGSEAVGAALEQYAAMRTGDTDQTFYLLQALTAHHRDAGLISLVEGSSPIFTDAVEIRRAQLGDTSALVAAIRAKVASSEHSQWIHAVDLSHFVGEEDALALTAPLLERAGDGDALTERLLALHFHRGTYELALLPKLGPLLSATADSSSYAALHLALHGDEEARASALNWLRTNGSSESWRKLQVALALLDHEDSKAGASGYLAGLDQQHLRYGGLDIEVLKRLAEEGNAVARERLLSIAFGESRDFDAVARAVEAVSPEDPQGAFHAARRLFANSQQLGSALTLMKVDPERGTGELLQAYVGARAEMKTQIGRTLRLRADPNRVLPVLSMLSNSVREDDRQMAAELGGWLTHRLEAPYLHALLRDPVEDVEAAAIKAIERRRSAAHADELINLIPHQPKPKQWAMLKAVVELVDPYILNDQEDILSIRPMLMALPDEFRIEANRLLERRIKDVERDIANQAREETRD